MTPPYCCTIQAFTVELPEQIHCSNDKLMQDAGCPFLAFVLSVFLRNEMFKY
jgi:hypothetical protein